MNSVNDGLILREELALKTYLQGLTVRDNTSPSTGRKVEVYYRLPEQEVRRKSYPYLTIDLLSINRDSSREHRGNYMFRPTEEYCPPGRTFGDSAQTSWPVPLLMTFQITSFARLIQHDLQIMGRLLVGQLAERFAAVPMIDGLEVASDHSIRRLDIVSGPISADSIDPADPSKRIFRKAWTVEMSSEYFPEELRQLATVDPNKIDLTVLDIDEPTVTA